MNLNAPISAGELLDKITILELKVRHISDRQKSALAQHELEALTLIARAAGLFADDLKDHLKRLRGVNETLWRLEDDIRATEPFDTVRVAALAQEIITQNNLRSAVKSAINTATGSSLTELKSY